MSALENAWKTLFGDSTDSIDAAGDAQQARIIDAIDILNRTFDSMEGELEAGKQEFIGTVKDTLAKVKSEILAGNADTAQKLKQGLDEQISTIQKTFDLSSGTIENAYKIIEGDLNLARDTATGQLTQARDTARGDITTGRDTALTNLRTSLTNSLDALSRGSDRASSAIRDSLSRTRQTYAPFIAAGQKSITRAEQLTNDPQAQLDFIQNNPFFSAMQETARDQLFSNQAARGRLGTGETLNELDKRTLLLGEQLLGNRINQNLDISGQGIVAAGGLANSEMTAGNILSNIFQNEANSVANVETNFGNNAASINSSAGNVLAEIATLFGRDAANLTKDTATNVAEIGSNFTGLLNNNIQNAGVQANNTVGNFWNNLTSLINNQTGTMAGLTQQEGMLEAGAQQDFRNNKATMMGGTNNAIVNLLLRLGDSEASEEIGEANAQRQDLNTLLNVAALAFGMPPMFGSRSGTSSGGSSGGSGVPFGTTSINTGANTGPFTMGNTFPYIPVFNPTPVQPFSGLNLNLR